MGDTLLEAMDKSKGRVSERVYRLLEEVNRGIVRVFFGVASTGSFTRSSDDDDTDDMNDVDRSSNDDDEARAKTVVQQYALPPMQSYLRAIFARLADQHYQLRVKTRGDGAKRTLVLYRTARTEQVARKLQVNSVSVASTIGVNAAPTTTADAVGTSSKAATATILDDHAYTLQHFADRALRSALQTVAGVDVDKIEHDWIISRQKGMPVGFDAKPLDEKNVGYRMFQRMGWEKEDQSSAASASVGEKGGSSSSNSAAPRPRHAEAISVIVKDDRKGF